MNTQFSLKAWNTFQVETKASSIVTLSDTSQIKNIISQIKSSPDYFLLGEGANVLFTQDIDGVVIRNKLKGRKVIQESEETILLEVSSGEDWHELVTFCVQNGWCGFENLAYIPGTVGAAVAQNIAAYGQNIEDTVVSVEGIDLLTGEKFYYQKADCAFEYRESIFKRSENKPLFITSVLFRLLKQFNASTGYYGRYESIKSELGEKEPTAPGEVFEAVIRLRKKKLPDWRQVGTAGSFFKNPIISREKYEMLSKEVTELQQYPVDKLQYTKETVTGDFVKVPAARLLDELGWRGKRIGNVGTFEKQALVIINLGGASGQEILTFSQKMQKDMKENFDIDLIPEVKII